MGVCWGLVSLTMYDNELLAGPQSSGQIVLVQVSAIQLGVCMLEFTLCKVLEK